MNRKCRIAMCLFPLILAVGCGGPENPIVGKWETESVTHRGLTVPSRQLPFLDVGEIGFKKIRFWESGEFECEFIDVVALSRATVKVTGKYEWTGEDTVVLETPLPRHYTSDALELFGGDLSVGMPYTFKVNFEDDRLRLTDVESKLMQVLRRPGATPRSPETPALDATTTDTKGSVGGDDPTDGSKNLPLEEKLPGSYALKIDSHYCRSASDLIKNSQQTQEAQVHVTLKDDSWTIALADIVWMGTKEDLPSLDLECAFAPIVKGLSGEGFDALKDSRFRLRFKENDLAPNVDPVAFYQKAVTSLSGGPVFVNAPSSYSVDWRSLIRQETGKEVPYGVRFTAERSSVGGGGLSNRVTVTWEREAQPETPGFSSFDVSLVKTDAPPPIIAPASVLQTAKKAVMGFLENATGEFQWNRVRITAGPDKWVVTGEVAVGDDKAELVL